MVGAGLGLGGAWHLPFSHSHKGTFDMWSCLGRGGGIVSCVCMQLAEQATLHAALLFQIPGQVGKGGRCWRKVPPQRQAHFTLTEACLSSSLHSGYLEPQPSVGTDNSECLAILLVHGGLCLRLKFSLLLWSPLFGWRLADYTHSTHSLVKGSHPLGKKP